MLCLADEAHFSLCCLAGSMMWLKTFSGFFFAFCFRFTAAVVLVYVIDLAAGFLLFKLGV